MRSCSHEASGPLLMGRVALRASYTDQNSFGNSFNFSEFSKHPWEGKDLWFKKQVSKVLPCCRAMRSGSSYDLFGSGVHLQIPA